MQPRHAVALAVALVLPATLALAAHGPGESWTPSVMGALVGNTASTLACADPQVLVNPYGNEPHNHGKAAHHAHGTSNFRLLAHRFDPLAGGAREIFGELVNFDHFIAQAVLGWSVTAGGFNLYDVSDPSLPKRVSSLRATGATWGFDVKVSTDHQYLYVGGEGGSSRGVMTVDISDPTAPRITHRATGGMGHMLSVYAIDGTEYVFSANQGIPADRVSQVEIFRARNVGLDRVLDLVATYLVPQPGLYGAHDTFVMLDPILNRHLLYVANGHGGIAVADVTDPTQPITIATMNDAVYGDFDYHHTVQVTFVEGRRILGVAPEAFEVGSHVYKFYDITDLLSPMSAAGLSTPPVVLVTPLGVWDSPFDKSDTHDFHFLDGLLYAAHYHEGVFVLEFSTLEHVRNPPVVGWYLPHARDADPLDFDLSPNTWDVVVHHGRVYASDIDTGFYVLDFACLTPGDPSLTTSA